MEGGHSRAGGRRRPTIADVAARTGLSKATVSRAMNDRPRVSSATRDLVLSTLDELGYIRSHPATSLSTGRSGMMALIIGNNRNPTVLSAIQGAVSSAAAVGYGVVVHVSDGDETNETVYGGGLSGKAVDGVVHLFPRHDDSAAIRRLQSRGVPVVLVDPEVAVPGTTTVWCDTALDGFLSVTHLLEMGHTRVAVCADVAPWGREEGYADGCRAAWEARATGSGELLVEQAGWTHAAGYGATARWLDLADPPTAICFCCDTAALGGMSRARELGLRLPDELALVGYDDTEVGGWVTPALTALRDRRSKPVEEACNLLFALLAGTAEAGEEHVLATELVVRESSRGTARAPSQP